VASGGLTQVVGHQLRSLSPAGAQVVKVASVLGPSFTVNDLSAMTGQPASGLLSAVEETLDAGVFVDDGGQLAFRHDLFRQAVYASIPAAMRPALHRGAADALLAAGAPIVRVATQVAIGAEPGDEAAIDILTQAIGELFGTSPGAAADLALRVLELVAEEDPRWPGVVAMAVGVLGWAGRVDEARKVGERFLAGRDVPVGLEAEIENGMRRAWGQSSHEPFPTPLPDHLVTDPSIPAPLRANLVVLTQLAATYLEPEERVKGSLAYARDLIAGTDDRETAATLLAVECNLAWEHGRLSDAYQLAQAALDRAGGTPPSFTAGTIESTTAIAVGAVGQPAAALKLLGIGHQTASACGNSFFMTLCTSERAVVLLELGRVNDARAEARAAFESADDLGFGYFLSQSVGVLVETSIRQGDLSEAAAATHRLLSIGGNDTPSKERSWVVALCEDANGRPGTAAEALAPVIDRLRHSRYLMYPSRLPQIVGLALRAGRPEYAEVAVRAANELAGRNPGVRCVAAVAAHAEGLLRSDPLALAHAVELLAKGEQPLATALAQEDLGQVLAKSNEEESAVDNLEAAYDAYVLADAYRDIARVRRALAGLGVRKRQRVVARPDRGWASLTGTESTVAWIVAQGHTNRETAAQLYVSPETVNTHLRHVFTKLGVRSRVELARFVIEHETG
jgi:DNA-binding CsgD family transcriptional regulator